MPTQIISQNLGSPARSVCPKQELSNWGSMSSLTDHLATSPPATFGGMASPCCPSSASPPDDLPGVHVVALHGELDISTVDGLADALVEVADSTVVVDLSGLTFMDSTGIAALMFARSRILAKDWASSSSLDRVRSSVRHWRSLDWTRVDRGLVAILEQMGRPTEHDVTGS